SGDKHGDNDRNGDLHVPSRKSYGRKTPRCRGAAAKTSATSRRFAAPAAHFTLLHIRREQRDGRARTFRVGAMTSRSSERVMAGQNRARFCCRASTAPTSSSPTIQPV